MTLNERKEDLNKLKDELKELDSRAKYNRDDIIRRSDVNDDGQPKVRRFIRWSKVSEEQILLTDKLTGRQKSFNKKEYDEFKSTKRYKAYIKNNQVEEEKIFITRVDFKNIRELEELKKQEDFVVKYIIIKINIYLV